ncbi:LOW QUALITY PROTEIN: predicted L-rhamnose isomerase RhaI [Geomicrobium sp. JCM 19037]|nr:LOW QUALITY PROTEIN: predicted L-rhamnose isomerase RhaI [Geomicrobium sp. JCM 19037]
MGEFRHHSHVNEEEIVLNSDEAYQVFVKQQEDRGIDIDAVKEKLKSFVIETPSWGYGDAGTRFKVFQYEGSPRNIYEKLEDAAQVQKHTGICPKVALHIPWDHVDDYSELKRYSEGLGLEIGAINPNLFQDEDYKYGSLTHNSESIRKKAIEHLLECVDIAKQLGSSEVSLWLADGSNYPGQSNIRARKKWLQSSLEKVYQHLNNDMRLLIEYKHFEPSFYHTDLADWGMAFQLSQNLGEKAEVLVDLGHHPQGVNVEQIVAYLLDEKKLGGFHFNNRKYADDDLMAGSINPYELFLILYQIVDSYFDDDEGVRHTAKHISYMIDQCHYLESKTRAMLQSVINIQAQYAKALLVDVDRVHHYQRNNDILGAEYEVRRAFEVDVHPLLRVVREEMGASAEPIQAYLDSGYEEKIQHRGRGGAGW